MAIAITDIKHLRKMTGAGMMDCKDALNEAEGNYDKAVEIIRMKGQAIAAKRENRNASEGCVLASIKNDFAALIAIKCETDFVAKGAEFIRMVDKILHIVLKNQPYTMEELKDLSIEGRKVYEFLTDKMGVTGEKVELGAYEYVKAPCVISYVHPGNKLATIVGFNQANADSQLIKDIAMQVAAMNPISIDKDSVPEEVVRLEKKIAREKAIKQGKSNTILDKIEEGALNKYFRENTLMAQAFIKDPKITIKDLLNRYDKVLQVTEFKRINLNKD